MPLPPGHIAIKRKRGDDSVDALYVDSPFKDPTTRRFTDFVYKRVRDINGHISTPEPTDDLQRKQLRAVTAAAALRSQPSNTFKNGVPFIKSSLAEDERFKPGLSHHPSIPSLAAHKANNLSTSSLPTSQLSTHQHNRSASSVVTPSPGRSTPSLLNLRRFHLSTSSIRRDGSASRSSSIYNGQGSAASSRGSLLDRSSFAVTKHRSGKTAKGRKQTPTAIVVEKFDRPGPVASSLAVSRNITSGTTIPQQQKTIITPPLPPPTTTNDPPKPRRRPIDEEDKLAAEMEQLALEMSSYAQDQDAYLPMPVSAAAVTAAAHTPSDAPSTPETIVKPKLKYQPKPTPRRQHRPFTEDACPPTMEEALASGMVLHIASNGQRVPGTVAQPRGKSLLQPQDTTATTRDETTATTIPQPEEARMNNNTPLDDSDAESDGEYVYDVFIRQPAEEFELEMKNAQLLYPSLSTPGVGESEDKAAPMAALPRNIGVVVITDEDAPFWEEFYEEGEEDEGKEWNSDDEDSNAEDHYANDYPEEEEEEEDSEDEEREGAGLWYDDDDDDDNNIYTGYRTGIRDFSDDDDDYY
ncbi:Transcription factor Iwr1 [Ascosphaera apis ARSEF 7405]|uniref:Transcription factor Iwr1 n=1 Tax=Ascosphaera apis ARSEF 7405 TaxID=392613 RepID=A0A167YGP4_9EURO|nr:Transcription factor Iwr1 [Ascosphaera apis ARSEF 7405]